MRSLIATLFGAALLVASIVPADAVAPPGMSAFSSELSDRDARHDYGRDPALGRRFLPRAAGEIWSLTQTSPTTLTASSHRFLRAMPRTLRRLYPAEFKPDTPGDVSDLLDECLPAAADFWKATLEARLADLDGLLALSQETGHRGHPKQMAKLRSIVGRTRSAIARADGETDPAKRYDRMIGIDVMTLDAAEYQGLLPSNYYDESSARVRFGSLRVAAAGPIEYDPWGERVPLGVDTTLDGGTLTVHAMFWFTDVQFEQQRDIHVYYDLAFVVPDAATLGGHAVSSASLLVTTDIVRYHGAGSTTERTFTLVDGTLDVTESSAEWLVGTFTLHLRSASGPLMTVRSEEFGVYRGP